MSIRHSSEEDVDGIYVAIADIPDAPATATSADVGTSRAYNNGAATVSFTGAATGGTPNSYTATTTPGSFTATGTSSPLTVTGLSGGTSYTVAVTATNGTGTSSAATTGSITATTVPATPSAPTATDSGSGRAYNNGAASVAFTAPASGGKSISSYTVTSTPGSFTTSGASSPLTLTGLQSATSYTYSVTATNANGTSTASSSSSAVTATTVPQAPTIGTATDAGTGTSVTVAYTAGATGGAAVSAYTATSSPGGFTGTGASPITVSGLTAGTAYTFTVTATNSQGTSAASSASNSVTPVVPSNFFKIATVTAAGGETSLSFTSIPSTYKSLQIRGIGKDSTAATVLTSTLRFNNDATNANYAYHQLYWRSDTGIIAGGNAGQQVQIQGGLVGNVTFTFGALIIDIVDYASTSKYKTAKVINGSDINGVNSYGTIDLTSAVWLSTAALSTISIFPQATFVAGSTYTLYGVS